MHHLHTTPAIVLGSYEHGESNRVYRLFTRELGLLYVHGQGVRALKNRNRYALATHSVARVTLVRGRETWRLTSGHPLAATPSYSWRRVASLSGRLLPREDPAPEVFDVLSDALPLYAELHEVGACATLEAQLALAVLHHLGYVALPVLPAANIALPPRSTREVYAAHAHRAALVRVLNRTLAELPGRPSAIPEHGASH